MFKSLLGLDVVAAIGVIAERHRTSWRDWHSTLAETGGVPLLAIAVMLGITVLAVRNRTMVTGILAGVITTVGAVVTFGVLLLPHLLSNVEHNAAGGLAMLLMLALGVLGLLAIVIEIAVRIGERRKLEASDPEFPAARVVRD